MPEVVNFSPELRHAVELSVQHALTQHAELSAEGVSQVQRLHAAASAGKTQSLHVDPRLHGILARAYELSRAPSAPPAKRRRTDETAGAPTRQDPLERLSALEQEEAMAEMEDGLEDFADLAHAQAVGAGSNAAYALGEMGIKDAKEQRMALAKVDAGTRPASLASVPL